MRFSTISSTIKATLHQMNVYFRKLHSSILILSINKSPWLASSVRSSIYDVRNIMEWYFRAGMRQEPDAIVNE